MNNNNIKEDMKKGAGRIMLKMAGYIEIWSWAPITLKESCQGKGN